MKNNVTVPVKSGVAVFKTTPYGERLYNGCVRTYFRNEVRVTGSVYRVVEVTLHGRTGEETVLCEYIAPTEYPHLMQAIGVAVKNRKEFLQTQAEENAHAGGEVCLLFSRRQT